MSTTKHQALSLSSGGDCGAVPWAKRRRKNRRQKGRKNRRGRQVDTGDALEQILGVEGGDLGQESGSGSSGDGEDDSNGMDTGNGPDPMVGVEAVDVGKELVVGSPTSVARRVLPALLQQSDFNMMTEYERIAAKEAHLDASSKWQSRYCLAFIPCGPTNRTTVLQRTKTRPAVSVVAVSLAAFLSAASAAISSAVLAETIFTPLTIQQLSRFCSLLWTDRLHHQPSHQSLNPMPGASLPCDRPGKDDVSQIAFLDDHLVSTQHREGQMLLT